MTDAEDKGGGVGKASQRGRWEAAAVWFRESTCNGHKIRSRLQACFQTPTKCQGKAVKNTVVLAMYEF